VAIEDRGVYPEDELAGTCGRSLSSHISARSLSTHTPAEHTHWCRCRRPLATAAQRSPDWKARRGRSRSKASGYRPCRR
jgi:hypothetical protein